MSPVASLCCFEVMGFGNLNFRERHFAFGVGNKWGRNVFRISFGWHFVRSERRMIPKLKWCLAEVLRQQLREDREEQTRWPA
jgi:hypothetical protein